MKLNLKSNEYYKKIQKNKLKSWLFSDFRSPLYKRDYRYWLDLQKEKASYDARVEQVRKNLNARNGIK